MLLLHHLQLVYASRHRYTWLSQLVGEWEHEEEVEGLEEKGQNQTEARARAKASVHQ